MKKEIKALTFLARICPERIKMGGQECVLITEVAYEELIKILSSSTLEKPKG